MAQHKKSIGAIFKLYYIKYIIIQKLCRF